MEAKQVPDYWPTFLVDFLHLPHSNGLYVSDEVFKEIEKRKFRFFKNRYCDELGIPPWSAGGGTKNPGWIVRLSTAYKNTVVPG